MVSPQILLGVAIGLALGLIGAYVLWLNARLDALEDQQAPPAPGDAPEPGDPGD